MNNQFKSFNTALNNWAKETPNKIAYTFLKDGENQEENITYKELEERAKAIAATLQMQGREGDRVILLFPSSIDFISSFFGCLYAGMIAVPVYHKVKQNPSRFLNIIEDASPSIMLGNKNIINEAKEVIGAQSRSIKWQGIDTIQINRAKFWRPFTANLETTAFLQYTSGSTSAPKGVIVSHENLLHQFEIMEEGTVKGRESNIFTWLPLYHDMGLIGNALFNTYLGARLTFMTPTSFIKKPIRWLKAVSKYKVNFSGAPNFAYELVIRKTTEADFQDLDLSNWEVAFCGAEPIRYETLRDFAIKLRDTGFHPKALLPCYGLAEATLMVTGSGNGKGLRKVQVDKYEMDNARAKFVDKNAENSKTLVSSGTMVHEQEIRIVHPEKLREVKEGEVGEIWIAGKHVAKGYWNKPEVSKERLQAKLEGEDFNFLRTGDLGFMKKGQLFVTGRIKDLIKVRGRGIYPQDLEYIIDDLNTTFPEVRKGGAGVFAINQNGREAIAAFVEVKPRNNKNHCPDTLSKAIIKEIAEQFDVALADVVLIKSGTLPKTTSGKIQRHNCYKIYSRDFKDYFKPVFQWSKQTGNAKIETEENMPGSSNKVGVSFQNGALKVSRNTSNRGVKVNEVTAVPTTDNSLQEWLTKWLSDKLGIATEQIDPKESLMSYGLDSIDVIELVDCIESKMNISISSTTLHDLGNIEGIVNYLTNNKNIPATA